MKTIKEAMKNHPLNGQQDRKSGNGLLSEQVVRIKNLENELAIRNSLLKEVFAEYEILKIRVKELQTQLDELQNIGDYKSASTWISKIVFMLRHESRPLRSTEMIALLERREAHLLHHHNKVQYFSAFLTQAVRYKRIIAYKLKGVRGYYYLLPDWVDKNGKPKPEFMSVMI